MDGIYSTTFSPFDKSIMKWGLSVEGHYLIALKTLKNFYEAGKADDLHHLVASAAQPANKMSKILGKRKAREPEQKDIEDLGDAQAIFRRHFEAQFKPLPAAPIRPSPAADEDDDTDSEEGESEWEGISEDGDGMLVCATGFMV